MLIVALLLTQRGANTRSNRPPPRIAVFAQPGFPYYGVNPLVSPKSIAKDLRAAGLPVDLLDLDALTLSTRLNTKHVVLPYGNTFPQAAFPNLKRFHQGGGSLVTTGIPFTHPVIRGSAKGWEAIPGWNTSVRLASGQGKRPGASAFLIRGSAGQWAGAASPCFAVQPGAERRTDHRSHGDMDDVSISRHGSLRCCRCRFVCTTAPKRTSASHWRIYGGCSREARQTGKCGPQTVRSGFLGSGASGCARALGERRNRCRRFCGTQRQGADNRAHGHAR